VERPPPGAGRRPSPALALVGRDADVAAVSALLAEPDVRLVTLTGVGGVGKTRLARVLAEAGGDAFPDGTLFVPLAPVQDPAHVVSAIGRALGTGEQGDRLLLDAIVAELRGLAMLLVLDNFEHLMSAATLVAEILDRCPALRVLATSRSSLRLSGEREYPVEPLALPAADGRLTAAELAGVPAVELFVARARMAAPGFRLDDHNAAAVAAICSRLDGVPLALQLAAAGVKMLSPAQMLERLASPLDLLVGGARDLPARQQTLRGTLEWSHGLLSARERRLFARLSVFTGGCPPSAAEAIGGLGEPTGAVLSDLISLVDYSLLRRREDARGEARLGMLQTIRAFAQERLSESGEEARIRAAHADLHLALAEEASPAFTFDGDVAVLERVEAEHDNLRSALRWCIEGGDAPRALGISAALAPFWLVRGHLSEGRAWLDRVLAMDPAAAPPGPRARALCGAGTLAHYQNAYALAAERFRESLALARAIGDRRAEAEALAGLAATVGRHQDPGAAREMYAEALAIAGELGDAGMIVSLQRGLGSVLWYQGDVAAAGPLLREALARADALGRAYDAAGARQALGWIALSEGEPQEARALLERCAAVFGALQDRWGVARCRLGIGYAALAGGDPVAARGAFAECLRIVGELGHKLIICACLGGFALAAARDGRPERAATLFGAATALRATLGANHSAVVQRAQDEGIAAVAEALGGPAFRRAFEEGAGMSLDAARAVAEGLAAEDERQALGAGLTLAELRVVRLVADGLTNAQVAGELVVSERTVHAHLRSIYRKLEVGTRTAAARAAIDRGLVSPAG
jgi:predicted ATPase/DNA-binding CsgD family transcriptional regulator